MLEQRGGRCDFRSPPFYISILKNSGLAHKRQATNTESRCWDEERLDKETKKKFQLAISNRYQAFTDLQENWQNRGREDFNNSRSTGIRHEKMHGGRRVRKIGKEVQTALSLCKYTEHAEEDRSHEEGE